MADEVKEKKPNAVKECFSGFGRFLYNPDDKTVLGRGGKSWGKITLFYFIFYSCLACFFAVCLHVMLQTIPEDRPTVIGRTNKPYVAVGEKDLYTMNFKNGDQWGDYKIAAQNLKKKYEDDRKDRTETDNIFDFSTLGECGKEDSVFAVNTADMKKGCFFMGLNRLIGYEPADNLVFNCEFDVGRSGRGNIENPPFDIKMMPSVENQNNNKYYPWLSVAKNGYQPLAAVQVKMDIAKASNMEKDKLETYLLCNAFSRSDNGTLTALEDARPALFTIKYDGKKSDDE